MGNYQVTYIRKSHPNGGHEHITAIGNSAGNWEITVSDAIRRIDSKTDSFYVQDPKTGKVANVGVVRPTGRNPYLRTHADGLWNDNLLSLPTYPSGQSVTV